MAILGFRKPEELGLSFLETVPSKFHQSLYSHTLGIRFFFFFTASRVSFLTPHQPVHQLLFFSP